MKPSSILKYALPLALVVASYAITIAFVYPAVQRAPRLWELQGQLGVVLTFPVQLLVAVAYQTDEQTGIYRMAIVGGSFLPFAIVAYTMHCLIPAGLMDAETAKQLISVSRSAGDLWLLPVYFAFIKSFEGDEEGVNGRFMHFDVPGGISIAVRPGTHWHTVLGSKRLRASITAVCIYFLLTFCTAAAVAAGLGLKNADTWLPLLGVSAAVSMVASLPRFVFPRLNSLSYTKFLFCSLIPPAMIAARSMQQRGVVDIKTITDISDAVCGLLRILVIPLAFLIRGRGL